MASLIDQMTPRWLMEVVLHHLTATGAPLVARVSRQVSPMVPSLLVLVLVLIVGGYEGHAWRRHRLYAGYYRLLLLASAVLALLCVVSLGVWVIAPAWMSLRTLVIALLGPCGALGWSVMAGRPVMR
jgi:hypothetical protein